MARTGIKTAPGNGPQLETIPRGNGNEVPVVTAVNVGTWGYEAGQNGSVTLLAGQRLLSFSCVAGDSGATVRINGGDVIPLPAGMGFSASLEADVLGATLLFTGTVSFFIQYVEEAGA